MVHKPSTTAQKLFTTVLKLFAAVLKLFPAVLKLFIAVQKLFAAVLKLFIAVQKLFIAVQKPSIAVQKLSNRQAQSPNRRQVEAQPNHRLHALRSAALKLSTGPPWLRSGHHKLSTDFPGLRSVDHKLSTDSNKLVSPDRELRTRLNRLWAAPFALMAALSSAMTLLESLKRVPPTGHQASITSLESTATASLPRLGRSNRAKTSSVSCKTHHHRRFTADGPRETTQAPALTALEVESGASGLRSREGLRFTRGRATPPTATLDLSGTTVSLPAMPSPFLAEGGIARS